MTEPNIALPEPPLFAGREIAHREVTEPPQLIMAAIQQQLPAEQMRELMGMYEGWENRVAEKAFNVAMRACQNEMPAVVHNSVNKQTGSTYANLEAVQKVRPVYSKYGFAPSFGEADCPTPGYKRTICDLRHDGGHTAHYHLDLPIDGIGAKGNPIGNMNAVQGCISTTNYGQRRLLAMMFNITLSGEDNDGQDVAKISEEEIANLRQWLVATATEEKRFLKWADIDSLPELPARKYDEAVTFFKRKSGQR